MKNYLITGTNRGIGLELCDQLLTNDNNNFIIACCRKPSNDLLSLANDFQSRIHVIDGFEVTSSDSVQELKDELNAMDPDRSHIDVLINNAGAWSESSWDNLDFVKMEEIIRINSIAPLRITHMLLENNNIKAHSKIVFLTSLMGSIADNTSGGRYSYRMSKAALNAGCKSLAIDLKGKNIPIGIVHPGWLATDMGGSGGKDVAEGVSSILARISELTLDKSGMFFHADGRALPW